MSKITTRASELAITLVLFEVGSTTLFILGAKAKQDAWLAMTLGSVLGLGLLLINLSIYRLDSNRDLFELCKRYLGRILGTIVSFGFTLYFIYESSRNLRDMGELTVLTLLSRTPIAVIMLIAIIVVANTVRYGPEVFFLVCLALFPISALGYLLIFLLVPSTGLIHWEFVYPILENGFKPVWEAAVPEIVSFPFGQTILFLVFLKMVRKNENVKRTMILAYISVSIFLICINQLPLLVLGPTLAANITHPLLEVVQLVQFAQVLERSDVLFALLLYLGLGIKMSAFFLGGTIGLQRITGISMKKWVIPVGAAIYALAFISPNYTEYIWLGLVGTVRVSSPVFQVMLPILLLIVMLIRKKKRQEAKQEEPRIDDNNEPSDSRNDQSKEIDR